MRQIEGCLDSMGPTLGGDNQAPMKYWSYWASEGGLQLHSLWHSRWVRMVVKRQSRLRGLISSPYTPPPVECPVITVKPQR